MKKIKTLFTTLILAIVMVSTSAFTPNKTGKVIMIINIEVGNFTEWKKSFDAGAPVREKAGIKVLSLCNSAENENHLIIIEEAESAEVAQNFLNMIKSKQKDLGLTKFDVKIYDKVD